MADSPAKLTPSLVQQMPEAQLEIIHSFLVHPGKTEKKQPFIRGTSVPLTGKLYDMLADLFRRAYTECNIEIVFAPDEHGNQKNEFRDRLVRYAKNPKLASGREIAESLQRVTTNRSGLGLLFLLKGTHTNGSKALVISRFPASQGITATESACTLAVEFIEQVFMKSEKAYKSAFFQTVHLDAGFQEGRAIDRQSIGTEELSNYWIRDFLKSQMRTTGPAGTRRLAEALRGAVKDTEDPGQKQELVAAATLLRGQAGRTQSTVEILGSLGISDDSTQAIREHFPKPELMDDTFTFDSEEFGKHIGYRTVELDNGAILTADDKEFSNVFQQEQLGDSDRSRFTTEGTILNQRFRKTK